jgi:hypothetical protein
MEKNNEIPVKKDELGIIPINVRELLKEDIKNACVSLEKNFDFNDDKVRESFERMVSNDCKLLTAIKEEAFNAYVRNLVDGCPDFHLKEFLIWNYNLDAKVPSEYLDIIVSYFSELVYSGKHKEIGILKDKWSRYFEILKKDYIRIVNQNSVEEDFIFFIDEDEFKLEDGPEKPKLEERMDFLKENLEDIERFLDDPFEFDSDRIIDETERTVRLKLIRHIIDNAPSWEENNLLARVKGDIIDSKIISLSIKKWFISSLEDYIRNQNNQDGMTLTKKRDVK